jgi:uncharacterized protein
MHKLRVNVAELLRWPGSTKDVEVACTAAELGITDPRVPGDAQVTATMHVESLSDGVVVSGKVAAPWHDVCRRCLADIDRIASTEVRDLFQVAVTDPDAFPVVGDQIDLADLVRETVHLELPLAALCRDDCAGLCATCGVDRNLGPCTCAEDTRDHRWAALDALLDLPAGDEP